MYLVSCPAHPHFVLLYWLLCCPVQSTRFMDKARQKIFCVSCGKSISTQVALRHMEHCFAKVGALAGG